MRVFTGALATETNTFAPIPTTLQDFKDLYYFPAGTHPDELTIFTAPTYQARQVAKQYNWELIEGLCAGAQPSGTTTRETYESLRDELLSDLNNAGQIDIVLLMLHGAMVADGYDDCEGDVLKRVRAIVGDNCTVGVLLDPHAHLTPDMLEHSDVMVFFKEYPHTDVLERAVELVDLSHEASIGKISPSYSVYDCEQIDLYHTTKEPMLSILKRVADIESEEGILSLSLVHGFPWGDVKDMGSKVLVVSDDNQQLGDKYAAEVGAQLKKNRGKTGAVGLSTADTLKHIKNATSFPIVVSDGSDNPGGGAPGDSTYLYHALTQEGIKNIAIGAMWDPIAADIAISKGIGAKMNLRMGGKVCELSGDPIDLYVEVTAIKKGASQMFSGAPWPAGNLVRLSHGDIDIVLCTNRTQTFHPSIFEDLGIDLSKKNVVVVKSSQHFYSAFNPIAKEILYCRAMGVNILDLSKLAFEKIKFPKWPWQTCKDLSA